MIDYLQQHGNLLWLLEPGSLYGLEKLGQQLGIQTLEHTILDNRQQQFGVQQQDFILLSHYPDTAITRDFAQFTLFPQATGLLLNSDSGFNSEVFLQSSASSWLNTNARPAGPLILGLTLQRQFEDAESGTMRQQRIAVIGDGDFLANAYLGNGGNLELGLQLFNWLSNDDEFITIPVVNAPDRQLILQKWYLIGIAAGFLIILPLGFLAIGARIWLQRRRH